MSFWSYAAVFAVAAVASAVGVGVIRRVAPRVGLIDVPNDRSLHATPKPRGGGLAIVLVAGASLVLAAFVGARPPSWAAAGYIASALVLTTVSAVDDRRPLPAILRLTIQVIAALVAVVVLASGSWFFDAVRTGLVVVGAAVIGGIWVVGLTNTYNFMDGIDGLVGAQGLIAGMAWAIFASINGQRWYAMIALLISGGSLGFLTHNWSPARIFLGDVGSAFLGFTFAYLTLAVPHNPAQLLAAVVISWPLLFDASFTLLRRLIHRENVFEAHRTHLFQRAVLAGVRPAFVSTVYALATVVSALTAFLLWTADSPPVPWVASIVVVCEAIGLFFLALYAESRRPQASDAPVTG